MRWFSTVFIDSLKRFWRHGGGVFLNSKTRRYRVLKVCAQKSGCRLWIWDERLIGGRNQDLLRVGVGWVARDFAGVL